VIFARKHDPEAAAALLDEIARAVRLRAAGMPGNGRFGSVTPGANSPWRAARGSRSFKRPIESWSKVARALA
jgi:hypothetical protein